MKNFIFIFILILISVVLVSGCSPSRPEIANAGISDSNPVTGQRIMLQVYSVTDNPPMRYIWNAGKGQIEDNSTDRFWVYWIAPSTPGPYIISCMVIDDEDKDETFFFQVNVVERELKTLIGNTSELEALSLATDRDTRISGVWCATKDKNIQYFSSTSEPEPNLEGLGWGGNFLEMAVQSSYSAYYGTSHTVFGAEKTGDECIYYSDGKRETSTEGLEDIQVMEPDGSMLWVGAKTGLFVLDTSDNTWANKEYTEEGDKRVNDIFVSEDYLYLATTTGIYECDKADPQITTAFSEYPGNNPQSIYLDTDNQIWSIASGKVYKANVLSGSQPGYVANSLDQDLYGRIWCGGYATEDGFEWENLSGIDDTDDEIVESLVSPEGLVYLRSTLGCLYVWGK